MNGTLGYVKEKNNKAVKGILINGTDLKYGKDETEIRRNHHPVRL